MLTAILFTLLLGAEPVWAALPCTVVSTAAEDAAIPLPQAWAQWFGEPRGPGHEMVKAILKRGGPYADLYRRMGFALDGETLTVPAFENVLKVLNEAPIKPGRAYVDPAHPDRAPVFRGLMEPAPEGHIEVDADRMPEEILGPMIAAGYFPLSTFRLRHDLSHLVGYAAHPDFARAVQKLQSDYMTKKNVSRADKTQRFSYFIEAFTYIPEAKRAEAQKLLGPEFEREGYQPTVASQRKADEGKGNEAVKAEARKLLKEYHALLLRLGGAAQEATRTWHEDFVSEAIPSLAQRLDAAVEGHEYFGRGVPDLRTELARFKVALYYSIGLTPEKYVEAANVSEVPADHPVYRLFVASGVGKDVRWRTGGDGITAATFGAPDTLGDMSPVQEYVAKMRRSAKLTASHLELSRYRLRNYSIDAKVAIPATQLETLATYHAILSLPLAENIKALGFLRGRPGGKAEALAWLDRGVQGKTLDLSQPEQKAFVDLMDSVNGLRSVGCWPLIQERVGVLRAEINSWP